jgi:hypothetical protein
MRTVVCIGGGRFGAMAATEAARGGARVLVVDREEQCLARRSSTAMTEDSSSILEAGAGDVFFLKGDGIVTLLDILDRWVPDMVIPGTSGHLAAFLAVEHGHRQGWSLVPSPDRQPELVKALPPNSVRLFDVGNGVIVTSFMEEGGLCLWDCGQPTTCPVTGKSNPVPMHECIAGSLIGSVDRHVVLVTSSVGTVGGISGRELRSMLHRLDGSRMGVIWGIATSCRCHGIINLLRIA